MKIRMKYLWKHHNDRALLSYGVKKLVDKMHYALKRLNNIRFRMLQLKNSSV